MDWLWRESWGRGALKELQPIILSCPLQIPNQQRWENILEENYFQSKLTLTCHEQGGITCGAIDEPRKSSKAIDERIIINFCDKRVVISFSRQKCRNYAFSRQNEVLFYLLIYIYIDIYFI